MAVNPDRKEGLPKLREILRRQRDDIDIGLLDKAVHSISHFTIPTQVYVINSNKKELYSYTEEEEFEQNKQCFEENFKSQECMKDEIKPFLNKKSIVKNRIHSQITGYSEWQSLEEDRKRKTILSVLYTMVEVMRVECEHETDEQSKNRQTFAEELGIHWLGSAFPNEENAHAALENSSGRSEVNN
ncbi:hypothetical protein MAR_011619 [Mya arenaria]|uniref:Uncharacterized protein n=1 Tax=Mya arenaria TaxID=6604 RepID=A0ABY7FUL2_MYAAR|nr:hypothetical protein MAR_011619 [Mya arenaria]